MTDEPAISSVAKASSTESHQAGPRRRQTPSCWSRTWTIALDVVRDGLQSATFLHGRDGHDALGLGQRGWERPKQDGRVRFIGGADKRNFTMSTVVTMTSTIVAQRRHETEDFLLVALTHAALALLVSCIPSRPTSRAHWAFLVAPCQSPPILS